MREGSYIPVGADPRLAGNKLSGCATLSSIDRRYIASKASPGMQGQDHHHRRLRYVRSSGRQVSSKLLKSLAATIQLGRDTTFIRGG